MNYAGAAAVSGPKPVKVYASDPLTAAGVGALLRGHPEFVLLPEQLAAQADVIVIAVESVTTEFVDVLREAANCAAARLVVILNDHRLTDLFTAVGVGLAAVIRREEVSADKLSSVIASVGRGGAEFPSDIQGRLLTQIRQLQRDVLEPRGLSAHGMDNREVDVLRLLADGLSIREVADKLSYSERTVKNVLRILMTRLGLRNRTQAVAYAVRAGVI